MGPSFYNALGIFSPNIKTLTWKQEYFIKVKKSANDSNYAMYVKRVNRTAEGNIYSRSQKKFQFQLLEHLKNALAVVTLFPFFRTRHKRSFYDRTVCKSLCVIHSFPPKRPYYTRSTV